MKHIILFVLFPLLFIGCSPKSKGKIIQGNQISTSHECLRYKVLLKNTSSSRVITFTIKSTYDDATYTAIHMLAPGYEKEIGKDKDSDCKKIKYEIVGAFYPE